MNTAPRHEVLNVQIGHPRYEELVSQLREPGLLVEMWADAEHRLKEEPGKVWTVVVVREGRRWVPATWAAATVEQHDNGLILRCSDNYERRGAGRTGRLYPVAYQVRHDTVVVPAGLPAITYLHVQPIRLHETDGWHRTGICGTSQQPGIDPHEWWELRRGLDNQAPVGRRGPHGGLHSDAEQGDHAGQQPPPTTDGMVAWAPASVTSGPRAVGAGRCRGSAPSRLSSGHWLAAAAGPQVASACDDEGDG